MATLQQSKADELNMNMNFRTGQVLLPQFTTVARDALTASAGQIIYNTTTNKINIYNGTAWEAVTSA